MTVVTDAAGLDLSRWLRPGDRIVMGQGSAEPTVLVEALLAQAEAIAGLSLFTATSFSGLLDVAAAQRLRLLSMGTIGVLRPVAAAGLLGIIPCHVSQIGAMIASGAIGCDVAFVQVSPPDAQGNHSLGLASDYVLDAVRNARVVIAEVNEQTPFTLGDTLLPASALDVAVRVSRPPVSIPPSPATPTDDAVADHVAAFIGDGAVIQSGIGAAPEAVLRRIADRRDLGMHTGMAGDGLVDLVESGALTNARKEIDPGVNVTGLLFGTERLFRFAHRNPALAMRGSHYTHGAATLARLSRLVTINSALEVDLTGQVNAEQSGEAYLGATGGQVDYVRAGARSPGGRSIIALASTARGGSVSRIRPLLTGPVTTARSEVDVIVTEHGAAELKGLTLAERAARLVAIADPRFREELGRTAHAIARLGF
jgi:acyl-CoA hydrolase